MKQSSPLLFIMILLAAGVEPAAAATMTMATAIATIDMQEAECDPGFAEYRGHHDVVIEAVAPSHIGLRGYLKARLVQCNFLFDTTISSCFWSWTINNSHPSCGTYHLWKCYNDSKKFQAETDFEIDIVFGKYADTPCVKETCPLPPP